MDTNTFFYEAVSLIIYISCVSCFSWLELFCHFRVHSCAFVVQNRLFVCFVVFVVPEWVFRGLTGAGLFPVAQLEELGTEGIITEWTRRKLTRSLCGGHECTTLRMWMWIFRFTGLLALRGCRVRGSHRWLWAFYMPRALGGIWSRFRHIRGAG